MLNPTFINHNDFVIMKKYIDENKYSRPGVKRKGFAGIAFHWTANAWAYATADWTTDYFEDLHKEDRYASTPYIASREPLIMQIMDDDELAYHVGLNYSNYSDLAKQALKDFKEESILTVNGIQYQSCNNIYTGLEMIPINANGKFDDDTIDNAIKWGAWQTKLHKIDLDKPYSIMRHFDFYSKKLPYQKVKRCPKFYVDNPAAWEDFMFQIRKLS